MSNQIICLTVRFKVKAGMEAQFKHELTLLAAATRAEAGCIHFHPHQESEDDQSFLLYEQWASQADLEKHDQMPHLAAFISKRRSVSD
jgi:quinol monooxygenase YgiN